MQGVWDKNGKRFPSKKAMREAIAAGDEVYLEATSLFGNEYGGALSGAPKGGAVYVVGPCPHTKRSWYAQINIASDGSVKVK